jgi:hypothetical protein
MKSAKLVEIEVNFLKNSVKESYKQFLEDAIDEIEQDLWQWSKQFGDQDYPWGKLQIKVKVI